MRELATAAKVRAFLSELGRRTRAPATVFLTGGATAVLHGWRESTIDIDVKFSPERDELFRAIQDLKEELHVNVELASPDLFVPVADDWQSASPWEATEAGLTIRHFDLRAQALAKIERGHDRDLADVDAMLGRGLVDASSIWAYFEIVRPRLHRYPAIDEAALVAALSAALGPSSEC